MTPRARLTVAVALTGMLVVVLAAQIEVVTSHFREFGHIHPTRPFAFIGPAMAAAAYWAWRTWWLKSRKHDSKPREPRSPRTPPL